MSSNKASGGARGPVLIGITGGMGSGKSTLSSLLRKKGFRVFDCDACTREMTKKGSPLLAELAAEFGEDILTKDGRLNRKRLARKAFADPALTARLNSMMHGEVLRRMQDFRKRYACEPYTHEPDVISAEGAVLLFAEIPLLYEAGWERYVDRVWLVSADEDIRRGRIKARDASISDEDISARLARQLPDSYKRERADLVFDNSGTVEELEALLDAALRASRTCP